ncbi:PREDICTED: pleckstrin homology domain-containing family M member 2-like [Branchiostoma belcheri]|uniref:Pleckstrin homology domain-containing family M member 2 n=1 Tax=Branchiostoma belcheri TaxID=7741 RepID=A0A6P4YUG3_BRABE|nr:PREDICTED: pleckstrin homology domain-containing family M member 2-like [Branchiostoma belcheri]
MTHNSLYHHGRPESGNFSSALNFSDSCEKTATMERLKLKDRILDNIARAVKGIQDLQACKGDPETASPLTNQDREIQALCEHLDHAFLHGLRNVTKGYWVVVPHFTRKDAIKQILGMGNVTTDLGRGRAWLYLALNENALESYLRVFQENSQLVRKYYVRHALLRDEQRLLVMTTLASGLEYLKFELDVDVPYLDLTSSLPLSRDERYSEYDDDRISQQSLDAVSTASSASSYTTGSGFTTGSEFTTPGSDSAICVRSEFVDIEYVAPGASVEGALPNGPTRKEKTPEKAQRPETLERTFRISRISDPGATPKASSDSGGLEVIRKKTKKGGKKKKAVAKQQDATPSPTASEESSRASSSSGIDVQNTGEGQSVSNNEGRNEGLEENRSSAKMEATEQSTGTNEVSREVTGPAGQGSNQGGQGESRGGTEGGAQGGHPPQQNVQAQAAGFVNDLELLLTNNNEDLNSNPTNCTDQTCHAHTYGLPPPNPPPAVMATGNEENNIEDDDVDLQGNFSHSPVFSSLPNEVPLSEEIAEAERLRRQQYDDEEDDDSVTLGSSYQSDAGSYSGSDNMEYRTGLGKDSSPRGSQGSPRPQRPARLNPFDRDSPRRGRGADQRDGQKERDWEEKNGDTEKEEEENLVMKRTTPDSHDADVKVDNNTLLFLMLEVFKEEGEQFSKMFRMSTGHMEGDLHSVYVLITDFCMYLLRKGSGDQQFECEDAIRHNDLDYISISLNHQYVQIVCTNRRKQFWVDTGDELLTRMFVTHLHAAMSTGFRIEPFPAVLTDATTQKIALRKWAAKEAKCNTSDIDLLLYTLVHWWDPQDFALTPSDSGQPSSLRDGITKDGVLLYKAATGYLRGTTWKSGFFLLSNGMLYQYGQRSDVVPQMSIQLTGPDCNGCRRINAGEKLHSFEILLTDRASLELAATSDLEVQEWLQALCQAVSQGVPEKGEPPSSVVPCCLALTSLKLFACHEDCQTSFFRSLGSVGLKDISGLSVDEEIDYYCIVELDDEQDPWVLYFNCTHEQRKFIHVLQEAWSELFQVDLPVTPLEDDIRRRKCREGLVSVQKNRR